MTWARRRSPRRSPPCASCSSRPARCRSGSCSRTTGPGRSSVIVRYEFDCDFLDLFEVKSQSFGERDLAFAKTITPLRTSRRFDKGDRGVRVRRRRRRLRGRVLASSSPSWACPGDRACDFEVSLPASVRVVARRRGDAALARGRARPSGARPSCSASARACATRSSASQSSLPTLESSAPGLTNLYRQVAERSQRAADARAPRRDRLGARRRGSAVVHGAVRARHPDLVVPGPAARRRARARRAARAQRPPGERDSPTHDAEPGKILHEMRYGKVAALTGQFPYYGSVDSTLLYLILLSETWRWSGDDQLARELEPTARRALAWLDEQADLDGDGFVEFHRRSERGLEVQCWKDSWDSMQFADGTLARSPLAVCEVQGYAYAARVRCAELAREVWGDPELADAARAATPPRCASASTRRSGSSAATPPTTPSRSIARSDRSTGSRRTPVICSGPASRSRSASTRWPSFCARGACSRASASARSPSATCGYNPIGVPHGHGLAARLEPDRLRARAGRAPRRRRSHHARAPARRRALRTGACPR